MLSEGWIMLILVGEGLLLLIICIQMIEVYSIKRKLNEITKKVTNYLEFVMESEEKEERVLQKEQYLVEKDRQKEDGQVIEAVIEAVLKEFFS